MAERRQVVKRAEELGVEVTLEPRKGFFDAWTPKGFIFSATLCHCIAHHCAVGPWTAEVYDDMLESLSYGIEPCPDPDCEYCRSGDGEPTKQGGDK